MSSMMNKIADALTGHHNTNTTNTAAGTTGSHAQPLQGQTAGNQAGAVGNNFAGTNYSQQSNGALKEGAQVRDTGLAHTNNAATNTNTATTGSTLGSSTQSGSSHLGRDAALAGAATHTHSSSSSSLNSSSMGSTSSASMAQNQTQTGLSNQSTISTDNAMTRSEEHLLVGKEKVNVGQAALHKYVTTEKVSTAVPIIREHAVVEREPITDANRDAAVRGPDFKEAHYEVNLMEERAVAEKEVVPIERVRLRKEVEQTQQYVEAELRKEHIELVDNTQTSGKNYTGAVGAGTSSSLQQDRTVTGASNINSQAQRNL